MRETFGHGTLPSGALQRIVTDGLRGAEAFLDIARFEQILVIRGPDAGIAIGLQLHRDLQGVALDSAGALLGTVHLVGRAVEILDMVADFMRDDIADREIAGRVETAFHFLEKLGVDVNLLVGGAVEWPHGGLRRAAARLAVAAVEDKRRWRVALSGGGEDFAPAALGRAEDFERGALDFAKLAGRGLLVRGAGRSAAAGYHRSDAAETAEQEHNHPEHRETATAEAAENKRHDHAEQPQSAAAAKPGLRRSRRLDFEIAAFLLVVEAHHGLLLRPV